MGRRKNTEGVAGLHVSITEENAAAAYAIAMAAADPQLWDSWEEALKERVENTGGAMAERAEERSGRFDGYSENRQRDAESAHNAVQEICDGIPLGQPILVGHHSEAHARRQQKKIETKEDKSMNHDDDQFRMDFADPGGKSALRAASRRNPRNLPCPTCGEPDRLTPADVRQGYQCDDCANAAEGPGW